MGLLIKNHGLVSIIAICIAMVMMLAGCLPAFLAFVAFFAVIMMSYGWMLRMGMDELAKELQAMFPDGRLETSPGQGRGRDHVQISFSRQVEGGFDLACAVECRKIKEYSSHAYNRGKRQKVIRWKIQSALTVVDSGQEGVDGRPEAGADLVALEKRLYETSEKWWAFLEKVPGLGNAGRLLFEAPGVRDAVLGLFNVGFVNVRFGAKGVVAEGSSFMDAQDVAQAMECLHTIAKARRDLAGRMGFDPLDTEATADGPCVSEAVTDDELYDDVDGGEGRLSLPSGKEGLPMDAEDEPAPTRRHRLHA